MRLIRFEGAALNPSNCLWSSLIRLRQLPGFCSCDWLFDPETGNGVVVLVWESEDAERLNRAECEAAVGSALKDLRLKPAGSGTFTTAVHGVAWDLPPNHSTAPAGGVADLRADLIDFIKECEDFENFQDQVLRW